MSTNRPTRLHANRFTLRHDTGNGYVGISNASNLSQEEVMQRLRDLRKQGDARKFVVTNSAGSVVAHSEL